MDETVEGLAGIADAIAVGLRCADVAGLTDQDLLASTVVIEAIGRRVDALRVTVAAEVADRSRKELGTGGLAARKASRSAEELLQRVTRVSGATARRRIGLGGDIRRRMSLLGEGMPARFERVAAAVEAGTLGVDAAVVISRGLAPLLARVSGDRVAAAEQELVAAAIGVGPDCSVPACADEIRIQLSV